MILGQAAVHTTGINWGSVITIIASICTIIAILGALIGKYVAGKITSAINEFRIAVVDQLDTRLKGVEQTLETISRNNPRRRTQ
jgi:ABC-type lipoprotein release transport system permease subunit